MPSCSTSSAISVPEASLEQPSSGRLSSERLQPQIERYERLLKGVASATNILLTGCSYQASINQALAILGDATQVDRVYIFETHPHSDSAKPAMSQRWEWAAPGISPEIDNPELQNLMYEDFLPRWHDELSHGRALYGPVSSFPDKERELLGPQGILSIVVVPIQIRGHFWGFIGFDQCSVVYDWTTVEVSTLRAIAGCLGGAIAQHHAERALQELNQSLEKRVDERTAELTTANAELSVAMTSLKETQAKLIHTEKMSSLGQLVAGIAHEINNPTNFINGNLKHAQQYTEDLLALVELYQSEYPQTTPAIEETLEEIDFDFVKVDYPNLMKSTKEGVARITHIVRSLRNFSRLDESDCKLVDIHQGIESTLNFLQHRLQPEDEAHDIEIAAQFDSQLPLVECFSGELNQAIMHVLTNAIDALEAKNAAERVQRPNRIDIRSELVSDNRIILHIADNGNGMTAATQAKMFDPFFTARPIGAGTGLGLSIAHQVIVKDHGGEITCQSVVGEGTTFKICLPVRQSAVHRSL
ncbi:MAG: ATP-binding protein [Cyanobacteria bacterium J06631_9]